MERKSLFPKNPWVKGLMTAAMVLGIEAGAGLVPGSGGMAGAAAGAAAAKASASGSGASTQARTEQPEPNATEPVRSYAGKRDPFKVPPPPLEAKGEDFARLLPPGKRGLVIGQLKLEGIVRQVADKNMLAVVTNQTNRAYFLRVHDEVYDGVVSAITADSVRFKENRLERGGRLETREIVLKIASPPEEGR
ncbi:MAG TPA: hypothetical protein VMV34_05970 [Terriglobia bacterium]|nr:hypothetical protein [Terriglobia bacterium]